MPGNGSYKLPLAGYAAAQDDPPSMRTKRNRRSPCSALPRIQRGGSGWDSPVRLRSACRPPGAGLLLLCWMLLWPSIGQAAAAEPAAWQPTERGVYQGFLVPQVAVDGTAHPIGALHSWVLGIRDRHGHPFVPGTITISGGMPAHGHGLPTQPQAAQHLGDGRFRIDGVLFNMPGEWVLQASVTGPDGLDTLRLAFTVQAQAQAQAQPQPQARAPAQTADANTILTATERATIADLTCDSDGKIDRFIDRDDVKKALEVHELRDGERYFLALFLNGAYQEILGDLHNLFGDTNAAHVTLDDDGYSVSAVIKGDSVQEVLGYVEYEPQRMVERVRRQAERARRRGLITVENVRLLMKHYEDSLRGYTYLTPD